MPEALLLLPIGLLAAFMFIYGSALTSRNQAAGWTQWFQAFFIAVPVFGPAALAAFNKLSEIIASALKPAFDYVDKKVAGFFAIIGQIMSYAANQAYRHSYAILNIVNWIKGVEAPRIQRAAVAQSTGAAKVAGRVTLPVPKLSRYQAKAYAAATLASTEAAILHKLAHDPAWQSVIAADLPLAKPIPGVKGGLTKAEIDAKVKEYVKAALAAAGLALPFPIPARSPAIPKKQAKENSDTNKRLKRLEKILGITGLAGLIGATFGKEIERFLRCKNTRGIAKAWCGADLNALLGLLGTLAVVEGKFSIVTLAEEMLQIEEDVIGVITGAFSELDGISA